jgi:hypothetical protein
MSQEFAWFHTSFLRYLLQRYQANMWNVPDCHREAGCYEGIERGAGPKDAKVPSSPFPLQDFASAVDRMIAACNLSYSNKAH